MRVERIGTATLYLGDCRDLLPSLPPADALISDPPYGIAFEHGGGAGAGGLPGFNGSRFGRRAGRDHRLVGDDAPFDPTPLLALAPTVALWGANHYAHRLPASRGGWMLWDKVPIAGYEGRWSFADGELCWFSRPFPLRIIRHYWNGGLRPGGEEHMTPRDHPTQKPVRVMGRCIELAQVKAGGLILDPYMGSGTTGVAAARLGHPFIGIEIDLRYFDAACRRIDREMAQAKLPMGERP